MGANTITFDGTTGADVNFTILSTSAVLINFLINATVSMTSIMDIGHNAKILEWQTAKNDI